MGIPLPPPWVLMSLVLGFAGHLQDFKELAGLGVSIVTGRGEDAGCKICDKLVTMMLKEIELDDMQEGGGIDCHGMCFGLGKCVNTCEKITGAMANSTGYPCIAAGLCPELDEFGEVSCKWSYSKMGCEPSSACEAKARFGTPKCELKAGHKQWKKAGKLINDQLNAVGDGLKNRKRCSEEGAGPYCIKDSEGLGLFCEYAGLVMTFFGGVMFSIRAIESPGGDDDRQWLTFWMIFFFFTIFERYADVLLSQTPRYYEIKMVVLVWLMFAEGADKIYRVVRSLCKKVAWLLPQRPQMTEEAYIKTLPKKMQRRAAEEGLEALFASFRCDYDVAKAFDEGVLYQLWAQWNKARALPHRPTGPNGRTAHLVAPCV